MQLCPLASDLGKEESPSESKEVQPLNNNSSATTPVAGSEKPTKRARRARHDTFSGLDGQNDTTSAEHVLRSQVASSAATPSSQKKTHGNCSDPLERSQGKLLPHVVVTAAFQWKVP